MKNPAKNMIFCMFFLMTFLNLSLTAPTNNNSTTNSKDKSSTPDIIAVEPESIKVAPFVDVVESSRKKELPSTVETIKSDEIAKKQGKIENYFVGGDDSDDDEEDSSEIYEVKLTKSKTTKKPPKKVNKKNPVNKNKDDDSDDLLADFQQGYKKVYSKISHWWRDLESSFAMTPISYAAPSKKVKKDSSSFEAENKSKNKPTTTKKPKGPTKKKKAPPPTKKNKPNTKQKEPEGWFDWNKVILVLGSIVTVLDLFGIR